MDRCLQPPFPDPILCANVCQSRPRVQDCMQPFARALLLRTLPLAFAAGCSGAPESAPPAGTTFLDRPSGPVPETLAELGLYPDAARLDRVHPRAIEYRPAHELWSNGSKKHRYLVLPAGSSVDTTHPDHWQFPEGSLFLKTFVYSGQNGVSFPVETRVLQRTTEGFSYGTYVWDESASSATLAPRSAGANVLVETGGGRFTHVVPAELDCRKCHESQASPILGFDELALNTPLAAGQAAQLEVLAERGILSAPAQDPLSVDHPHDLTREVLGYLHGNCVHCHNGGSSASAAFDLRYPTALENLIWREAEGEAISGIRVVPADPDASLLYQVLTRDDALDDVQPMPPLGVDFVDRAAVEMVRRWISGLDPVNPLGALAR